jgi:hypothetical protein
MSGALARLAPLAGVAAAIAAGAALRLALPGAIEWKSDEQWSFFHARQMLAGGVWPPVGMPSSVGPPNPGLSLWVFAGLEALFSAHRPPQLAHAVQLLNVAALAAFAAFALIAVPRERREPWLWALALWAVNPIAVVFERKIWPPSVLPLATVALLWAWRYRTHPAAAFAWGALGVLMAQVHMGAAFFALAIAAWTLAEDKGRFPWAAWIAGSLVGLLPAIPWALQMARHGAGGHAHLSPPGLSFYLRWVTQPFGWGLQYTLGRAEFARFLGGPMLFGVAAHLVGALQAALVVLAMLVLANGVVSLWRRGAPPLGALALGDSPATRLIAATLLGYGGLLTLTTFAGASSNRHYLIVATPIMTLWAALAVFWAFGPAIGRARATLAALCIGQALLTAALLAYVDARGVIPGEFGATFAAQAAGRTPPPEKDNPLNAPPRWPRSSR